MNTSWEIAIAFVLKMEGGYSNDPNDPGGETNFGISKRSYPNLDIKNITIDQAKVIYQKDYWQACACDQLPPGFDVAVFDSAVNQGTGKAARLLQIALDVSVDGIIGSQTITAAFKSGPRTLNLFLVQRILSYMQDKNFNIYSVNWLFRTISCAEISSQLVMSKI